MRACSSRRHMVCLIMEGEQTRKGHWALEIEQRTRISWELTVNLAWCYFRGQVAQWRGHLVLYAQLDSPWSAFDQWVYSKIWRKTFSFLFFGWGEVKMEIINQLEGRIEVDFHASENIAYLIYSLISVSYLKSFHKFQTK